MGFGFDEVINRRGTNSLKWTRYPADVLPLWVADMDFPSPEPVREALQAALQHGVFGYELPTRALKETVANRMFRLYGWEVSPEAVVPTPGIVAGFKNAARAFCTAERGVVVQPPVYPPFLDVARDSGTVQIQAPWRSVARGHVIHYELDWDAFEQAFTGETKPGMLLLCHPHNPTGGMYARADLDRIAETCLRHDTVICSDEIHSELLLGGSRHQPMAALSPEVAKRTITLVSSSKTFNVVGLFCGFAIIPDAELRRSYCKALERAALHVNSLGLIAAQAALGGACEDWLADLRAHLTGNRDCLVDFVRSELPGVRTTVPDATYLAWLDFGELVREGRINGRPYDFLLERAKVALNPGEEFGAGGANFVRLNFGCPRATLVEALRRIKQAVG